MNLKFIPGPDGNAQIAQLVEIKHTDVEIKSAFESNARLQFIEHVNAPVADLPIVKELGGISIQASLNLRAGKIIRDYVKE